MGNSLIGPIPDSLGAGGIQELSKTGGISQWFHLARRCSRAPKLEQFPNLLIACRAEF